MHSSLRSRCLICLPLLFGGCATMPEVVPVGREMSPRPTAPTTPGIVYALPQAELLLGLPVVQTVHTAAPLLPVDETKDKKKWVEYARLLNDKLNIKPSEIELQSFSAYALDLTAAEIASRPRPDPAAVFQVALLSQWPMDNKLTLKLDSSLILSSADNASSNQALATALKVAETAVSVVAWSTLSRGDPANSFFESTRPPQKPEMELATDEVGQAIDEVLRLRVLRRSVLEGEKPQFNAAQLQLTLAWIEREEARFLGLLTGTTKQKTWVAIARFIPRSSATSSPILATVHETFGLRLESNQADNAALNPYPYSETDTGSDGNPRQIPGERMFIDVSDSAKWKVKSNPAKQRAVSIRVTPLDLPFAPEALASNPVEGRQSYAYRIPRLAVVEAVSNAGPAEQIFARRELPVPQLGEIRYLPRRLNGVSGSLNFELHPETGALVKLSSDTKTAEGATIASSLGANAKTLGDANDELTQLTRQQKILEARKAIKAAEQSLNQ